MTPMQIVSTGLAALFTLYYGQAFFKKQLVITGLNAAIWVAAVLWAVVSWIGVK